MGMMRCAVLASGRGSDFQAICDAVAAGTCPVELVRLITAYTTCCHHLPHHRPEPSVALQLSHAGAEGAEFGEERRCGVAEGDDEFLITVARRVKYTITR